MTHSVQDKVKADWEKAQQQGSQRLDRIREILQGAANATFSELKDGTLEVESLGRQSLADVIEQFKPLADSAATDASAAPEAAADTPVPSWSDLVAQLLNLANDRTTALPADVIGQLQEQLQRFDSDMAQTYGDRYRPFQPLIQGLRSLVSLAYQQVTPPPSPADTKPMTIEVLDDSESPSNQD
ncbi:MAG: hypothetical protein KGQ93_04035 [Cyanobacteria bacterium REEB459]|nr:hypothetical protein [Cyanobacteria bacterium REEB459]